MWARTIWRWAGGRWAEPGGQRAAARGVRAPPGTRGERRAPSRCAAGGPGVRGRSATRLWCGGCGATRRPVGAAGSICLNLYRIIKVYRPMVRIPAGGVKATPRAMSAATEPADTEPVVARAHQRPARTGRGPQPQGHGPGTCARSSGGAPDADGPEGGRASPISAATVDGLPAWTGATVSNPCPTEVAARRPMAPRDAAIPHGIGRPEP